MCIPHNNTALLFKIIIVNILPEIQSDTHSSTHALTKPAHSSTRHTLPHKQPSFCLFMHTCLLNASLISGAEPYNYNWDFAYASSITVLVEALDVVTRRFVLQVDLCHLNGTSGRKLSWWFSVAGTYSCLTALAWVKLVGGGHLG
jgi:hypothetical protein